MTTKKTIKRKGAGKKRAKAAWQRRILNPPEIEPTFVVLQFNEAGYIRAVTPDQARQDAERLKAMDDQASGEYWIKAKAIRSKNRRLLGKRAQDAMSMLFAWAIATGWCDYGELISPDGQREMLDCFLEEALAGIRQGQFRKRRSDTIDKAYEWLKPKISHLYAQHETPTQKVFKDFWTPIRRLKQWQQFVRRHGGNEKALQRGILRRWEENQQSKKKRRDTWRQ